MPEEDRGNNIGGQPDSPSQTPPQAPPPRNQNQPPETRDSNPRQQEADAIRQLEQNVKTGEWWLIGISIATLLVNIGIAKIYYGQLIEMRKATQATRGAVGVASRTLTETQASNARQAALSEQARISSEKASHDALQATIDQFHQDQRAWVGLTGFTVEADPMEKIAPEYAGNEMAVAGFINSGKTPARNVHALVAIGVNMIDHALNSEDEKWMNLQIDRIRSGEAKLFINSAPYGNVMAGYAVSSPRFSIPLVEDVSMGAIAPNITFRYVHPRDFRDPPKNKLGIFVFGYITYSDVTNNKRFTKFCSYRPENWSEKLESCPIFNDME